MSRLTIIQQASGNKWVQLADLSWRGSRFVICHTVSQGVHEWICKSIWKLSNIRLLSFHSGLQIHSWAFSLLWEIQHFCAYQCLININPGSWSICECITAQGISPNTDTSIEYLCSLIYRMVAQTQEHINELEIYLTNLLIIGEFQQLRYHWFWKVIQQNYTQLAIFFKEIMQFEAKQT